LTLAPVIMLNNADVLGAVPAQEVVPVV
jgi:hypothetical protein